MLLATVIFAFSDFLRALSAERSTRNSDCRLNSSRQFLHCFDGRSHPFMKDHGLICPKILVAHDGFNHCLVVLVPYVEGTRGLVDLVEPKLQRLACCYRREFIIVITWV